MSTQKYKVAGASGEKSGCRNSVLFKSYQFCFSVTEKAASGCEKQYDLDTA